jgi:DNA mismatch endonuclease Vsr
MDNVSPQVRSSVMAKVRSQRNRSTEWRLRACLVRAGIRGWTLNPADIPGKPDFVFRVERVIAFVDGCYWHGCPNCYRRPSSNTAYWDTKVCRNRDRDLATTCKLRRKGWKVLRFWEHELSEMDVVLSKIEKALAARAKGGARSSAC